MSTGIPLLERGDHAFGSIPSAVHDATAVVRDIAALLDDVADVGAGGVRGAR
jgi:hypothetical protein